MEVETAKLEFNTLRSKNSKIIEPFRNLCCENENLVIKMVENIDDRSLIASNLEELCDSTKRVTSMMEQQNGITQDLFILTNKLLKKTENSNALSGYRDWISYFYKAVEKELGAIVWSDVQFSVYRKVREERSNYAGSEQECISRLREVLGGINMSLQDFELLVLMKIKSNKEFHGDELETRAQARERLQKFPDEMKCFKEPLLKLFNAFDIWNRQ